MDDGKPSPRFGNYFVSVHGGKSRPALANIRNLDEYFDFNVTLTARVIGPLDRVGDQQIARNIARVPLGQRQGFNAKLEQLKVFIHSNWVITVLQGQKPPSANDNLAAWAADSSPVYGFVEPARWASSELPTLVDGRWTGDDPDQEGFAIKAQLSFIGARRMQPQTASVGVFQ